MPLIKTGNMWDAFEKADHFIIITSAQLIGGELVMIEGMAKEVAEKFPQAPMMLGKAVAEICDENGIFGFIAKGKIGVMQDRYFHSEDSDENLYCINTGMTKLLWKAQENPTLSFHVEMPAQHQPFWLIRHMVERLPNNVTLWRRP